MKKMSFVSAVLAGLAAGGAFAHGDAEMDSVKAPNGGQLRMAGPYHYELVVEKNSKEIKENPVVVYITDHTGQKIPTAGATGTATLLAGKTKANVALTPDGDNRMKGKAKYASASDVKAIVAIALPGKSAEQARFTPLAVMHDDHSSHKH